MCPTCGTFGEAADPLGRRRARLLGRLLWATAVPAGLDAGLVGDPDEKLSKLNVTRQNWPSSRRRFENPQQQKVVSLLSPSLTCLVAETTPLNFQKILGVFSP